LNKQLTFITGNADKARFAEQYIGMPIVRHMLDLDEIQSLDLKEVVQHKLAQAYSIVKAPVMVEDVSLEIGALGRLPGTFIKFFVRELGLSGICNLIADNRRAISRCMIGYTDGLHTQYFEGIVHGTIVHAPIGDSGFSKGWDKIFAPDTYNGLTNAQLDEHQYKQMYLQKRKYQDLRAYLAANSIV
jgi:non-canonical purine NTP pyrophosphatase (RdgB/HAM1 family)